MSKMHEKGSMFLRIAVGNAEDDGGHKYELTISAGSSLPMVRSETSGRTFVLEWADIIKQAIDIIEDDVPIILKHLGWSNIDISYSGFWSQGDGASFVGTWRASDVDAKELKEHAPEDKTLHEAADIYAGLADKYPEGSASSTRVQYHGSHERSVCIETSFDEASSLFQDTTRDLMRWIYRTLEKEWEYVIADIYTVEVMVFANLQELANQLAERATKNKSWESKLRGRAVRVKLTNGWPKEEA